MNGAPGLEPLGRALLAMCLCGVISGCVKTDARMVATREFDRCALDFDGDQTIDIAVIHRARDKAKLVVQLNQTTGSRKVALAKTTEKFLQLECLVGDEVVETSSGPGDVAPKRLQTNGAYLVLRQAEGSAEAFFWSDGAFRSVWISD